MSELLWGAIFDWDGVIIDSSSAHEESWNRLAKDTSLDLPEGHFKRGFGRKNEYIIPEILRWTQNPAEIQRLSLRKEELYREVVVERGQMPLPGVLTWLQALRNAGAPCAIGSSTHRKNIELILEISGLNGFFDYMVTAEDVTEGKPSPEVFLKAAALICREPSQCVVFEDAHVGIAAARAGGMRVVGVATTHPVAELQEADVAIDRLDRLTIPEILKLFLAR